MKNLAKKILGTITRKKAQSESESEEAANSATEISTDSEFDQDPINKEPPKIFINDSHLQKYPGRYIRPTARQVERPGRNDDIRLNFKPLVEVDPSIVKREPLKNPLPGDYLLSKTASTEGIASKKSLELKKRYLLGGDAASNSSVLKSDSASALDTKFKSFASNISECQKLLNPATEISSSMQTFLQRIDRNNELNRSQHSMTLSKSLKEKYNTNNQEEKENRSIDSNKKDESAVETINTALIENKIREMSPEVPKMPEIIETVDLVTPEKKQPIVDLNHVEIPQNTIEDNKQFIENMEKSSSIQETNMKIKSKLDSMFIDLTGDSPPPKEQRKSETTPEVTPVPDLINNITQNKEEDVTNERPRSPAHETTIEVPQIWARPTAKEMDSDSLSNSSTSSLEDIPHFILDSATSPETQNEKKPPRVEVRDTTGELMQIDSLMIVDGQYVGDPDDLPLFQPSTVENSLEPSITSSSVKVLKFDTKNENKLESLKNLPLIVAYEDLENNKEKISPHNGSDDGDKTPMAGMPLRECTISNSEDDLTAHGVLSETELSDWAADDAVSENFLDVEFALNSGKGTIKRRGKIPHFKEKEKPQPTKNDSECGILKNLAIEEIDFMDTGSEAEGNEIHSTTNEVVIKNHGYVKFVDQQHSYNVYQQHREIPLFKENNPQIVEAINTEIVNVDFIEQGAYILNKVESPKAPVVPLAEENLLDSLDIDEDSLVVVDDKNAESLQTLTTTTETTEELTIVTSPLESLPRNTADVNASTQSSTVISSMSTPTEEKPFTPQPDSIERPESINSRKNVEDFNGYEEYVKSLQLKIAQISNGGIERESIERRSRRKISKNDLLGTSQDESKDQSLPKIEPPQVLSKKIEEITKERTKQKDIIHELVMNKLQAKKQLNAEKRLNRSKNRTLYMSSASPVPSSNVSQDSGASFTTPEKQQPEARSERSIKLEKAQSFAFYSNPIQPKVDEDAFKTPAPPPRSRLNSDLSYSTDKMREEARARARLKSNEDLGLSPEEKILMLRKRYNLLQNFDDQGSIFANGKNQSDDMKYQEKKLSISKSFNDISRLNRQANERNFSVFQKPINDCMSDPNLPEALLKDESPKEKSPKSNKDPRRDRERRKSLIQTVSDFFHKKKDQSTSNKDLTSAGSIGKDKLSDSPSSSSTMSVFSRFKLSPKSKEQSKEKSKKEKESTPPYGNGERCQSTQNLKQQKSVAEEEQAPPIPPLPTNYQRSDDEDFETNKNELKKLRAMSKASKQAELKRLRIAQEIKREQDEIDLKIRDLETRGVEIEKLLRGEDQNIEQLNETSLSHIGSSDEELLKELLEIWRSITQLKRRDEELIIRQQELQLEHRHAQLKEELSIRLSCSKLDKSAQDIAAEGAILTEMLELVAKRAALRPSENQTGQSSLQSENVSLPLLPPQTTINPLLQHQLSMKRGEPSTSYNYQKNPNRNSSSSQASNQKELDI